MEIYDPGSMDNPPCTSVPGYYSGLLKAFVVARDANTATTKPMFSAVFHRRNPIKSALLKGRRRAETLLALVNRLEVRLYGTLSSATPVVFRDAVPLLRDGGPRVVKGAYQPGFVQAAVNLLDKAIPDAKPDADVPEMCEIIHRNLSRSLPSLLRGCKTEWMQVFLDTGNVKLKIATVEGSPVLIERFCSTSAFTRLLTSL